MKRRLAQPQHVLQGGNWAVEAVVQFYVLVPLLARMLTHKRWQFSVVVIFIAVIAYRAYIARPDLDGVFLEHQLWARFDHFLIGMLAVKLVASVEHRGGVLRQSKWFGLAALLLGLAMFGVIGNANSSEPDVNAIWLFARMGFAFAAGCFIVYLVLAPRGVVYRIASSTVVVSVGMIGYSYFMGSAFCSAVCYSLGWRWRWLLAWATAWR